jgi:hypothetical protein
MPPSRKAFPQESRGQGTASQTLFRRYIKSILRECLDTRQQEDFRTFDKIISITRYLVPARLLSSMNLEQPAQPESVYLRFHRPPSAEVLGCFQYMKWNLTCLFGC